MSWSVRLSEISAKDLKDTGVNSGFTKDEQDPACHFSIGDQKRRTERAPDAGVNASWPKLQLQFTISESDYNNKEMVVELFNEGSIVAMKQ